MTVKEILSALAIALTLIAFVPYIRDIVIGVAKPHVFSWVIWGLTTLIAFAAQLEGKGGVGAWPIGVSGVISSIIALLAYIKRADIAITKTDGLFFGLALGSIPLWYITADPVWAVVLLTVTDVLGFGPTLRKAFWAPHSEPLWFYALFAVRNATVIAALETYSLTTVLFPAAIAAACLGLILLVAYRRHALRKMSGH